MSVRNGFTIEIYEFMHSLRTFWHVPLRMPSCDGMEIVFFYILYEILVAWRSRLRTQKMEDDPRTSPDVWKMVNYSTKG